MTLNSNGIPKLSSLPGKTFGAAFLASALALTLTTGCSTKNYVRSQTGPLIQQTNELDAKTAQDHRDIQDTDQRAQAGITKAQSAADQANQHAVAAGQSADQANQAAEQAVNHVQSLEGVVANLDNYKTLSDVSVTFGFDKSKLTEADRDQLDQLASNLQNSRGYIIALTGGTDSVGNAQYNYQLSQRRADAVVLYLATKYNIAPHRFYEIGIGEDNPVADNHTREGRAENRRVEIKLMSNMAQSSPSSAPVAPAGGE
ncbi:MAG TPA: OmpA family protein [Acidobacteriaceae bacterium]|nr:OmpA family protein [Acidobacteriaceae bacterium]